MAEQEAVEEVVRHLKRSGQFDLFRADILDRIVLDDVQSHAKEFAEECLAIVPPSMDARDKRKVIAALKQLFHEGPIMANVREDVEEITSSARVGLGLRMNEAIASSIKACNEAKAEDEDGVEKQSGSSPEDKRPAGKHRGATIKDEPQGTFVGRVQQESGVVTGDSGTGDEQAPTSEAFDAAADAVKIEVDGDGDDKPSAQKRARDEDGSDRTKGGKTSKKPRKETKAGRDKDNDDSDISDVSSVHTSDLSSLDDSSDELATGSKEAGKESKPRDQTRTKTKREKKANATSSRKSARPAATGKQRQRPEAKSTGTKRKRSNSVSQGPS